MQPDTTTIRIDRTLYVRLISRAHKMEKEEERRISMNEVIEDMLDRLPKTKKARK